MNIAILAFVAAFAAQPALADGEHRHGNAKPHAGAAAVASSAAETDGEVRKVDKAAKKITIKHGPIANLDMPAMTMVFQAQDAALLDKVKAGDKVKFRAEKIGGGFAVTAIEPAH